MAGRVQARLTASEGRRFGLVVGGAFAVLGAILLWRGRRWPAYAAGGVGALLIAAGLLIPTRLGPIQAAWMRFAERLSRVTTPIFMTLIFVLAFLPTGLVLRAVGHRPLVRRRQAGSFWVDRAKGARQSNLRHQF
ncbi:MAG TPA: SxtJ family membrane protein [Gemmatimonadales bacterium]|nr:SxtJ family membrane protein [Gemmatimonadales bacterium]